ncbi:hypothetical protein INT45_000550 [Circinella minor]|uniref:RhoGAP-domain-containing protein n=1 Tax=Circinella minor TaxID=1195481 RepID=A0A8H7SBQ2_9FUNG|nr:hypothetical protein INT45_000550 [Circinella minor]
MSDNNQNSDSQDDFAKINMINNNYNNNNKLNNNNDYNGCPPPESPLSPPILGTTVTAMMRERRRRSSTPQGNDNRSRMKANMSYRGSINETLGRPLDKLCVEMGNEFVKQNSNINKEEEEINQQDLHHTKERLEKTCDSLRQQRDNLASEITQIIAEFSPSSRQVFYIYSAEDLISIDNDDDIHGESTSDNSSKIKKKLWERLRKPFEEQLNSIQEDIQAAKSNYIKLMNERNEIMNEMVLLNTKNAELNAMNNDLSLRVSEREKEAIAFVAGTIFLDDEDRKPSPRSAYSGYNTSSPTATMKRSKPMPPLPSNNTTEKSDEHQQEKLGGISKIKKLRNSRFMFGKLGSSSSSSNCSSPSNKGSKSSTKLYQMDEPGSNGTVSDDTESIAYSVAADGTYFSEDTISGPGEQHSFYQTKFLRPVRCDVCDEKMWRSSELKCQGCGSICHLKCMKNISQECLSIKKSGSNYNYQRQGSMSSNSIKGSVVFGNDLGKQVQLENSKVPLIVRRCVEAVEARGMEMEGIYRKSGGAKQIRDIQELFDQGQTPDLTDDNKWNDINAVTSVLKQYFRKLPDPLFTYQFHHEFIKNTYIKDLPTHRLSEMYSLLHTELPPENKDTIQYLMCHLYRVQKRDKVNFMNTRNLAVIFGPTLLRNMDDASDLLEMSRKIETIDYILNHCNELFDC